MTKADLRTETQRLVNKRTSTQLTAAWYDTRVLNGYLRLVSFQGLVLAPNAKQPTFRVLRFPILEDRLARTLDTTLTSNFVANQSGAKATVDVFNRTDNVGLQIDSERSLRQHDPDDTGKPILWEPGAKGGARGYYIWPYPGVAADNIDVYEYVISNVSLATDGTSPVVDPEWHMTIAYFAAAEAATLLDMPEKSREMNDLARAQIAELVSPGEVTAHAGRSSGRRRIRIGGWS